MAWHDSADARKAIGDNLQDLFRDCVTCACGGHFDFIGGFHPGFPDFTCENCGQLVEVKSSPQAERTGNLAISAIPWTHYPDDVLIVTCIKGKWIGEFKKNITPINRNPNPPTHQSQHKTFKNTEWFLISWKNFRDLQALGFGI